MRMRTSLIRVHFFPNHSLLLMTMETKLSIFGDLLVLTPFSPPVLHNSQNAGHYLSCSLRTCKILFRIVCQFWTPAYFNISPRWWMCSGNWELLDSGFNTLVYCSPALTNEFKNEKTVFFFLAMPNLLKARSNYCFWDIWRDTWQSWVEKQNRLSPHILQDVTSRRELETRQHPHSEKGFALVMGISLELPKLSPGQYHIPASIKSSRLPCILFNTSLPWTQLPVTRSLSW